MNKEFNMSTPVNMKKVRKAERFYGRAAGLLAFGAGTIFQVVSGIISSLQPLPPGQSRLVTLQSLLEFLNINIFALVGMGVLATLIYYGVACLAIRKDAQRAIGIKTGIWGGLTCGLCGLFLWIILSVGLIVYMFIMFTPVHPSQTTVEIPLSGMILRPYPWAPFDPFLLFMVVFMLLSLLQMMLLYYFLIMGLIPGLLGGVLASWLGKRR